MKEIKRCTRCVMDNSSDNTIVFDENGVCNYCKEAISIYAPKLYFPNEEGEKKLNKLITKIKVEGKGKPYDCIMGISGGLDSSYLAYLGFKWGLRILAVHIDDGYDTDISKENIRKLCKAANIELRTIVPDAEQYNALTLAYMKAGVPDIAVPQDNILFAFLYDTVKSTGLKYFLAGTNFALESILQRGNTISALDTVNIYDIHKRFGEKPINKLRFVSSYRKYFYQKIGKVITVLPLNYIDYNKDRAFKELNEFCGFQYYGKKHLENKLTAFIQLYWLPKKFGVDKRTSHLSSMIVSGQLSRENALEELKKPLYDETMMEEYINEISNNLGITTSELYQLVNSPGHQHSEYRTDKISLLIHKILC